ncbi:MAG: DNA double-strand break repair nuclease NurA [Candidatus Hodarchaeaceae archaeon]|nr:DNA double-strand break repair nuclease NurA [Candidatus Hodarchaeaceae archaeon]
MMLKSLPDVANRGDLELTLAEIVGKIREQEVKRRRVAELIKVLKDGVALARINESKLGGIVERRFSVRVEPDGLVNATTIGVDGGVLARPLHGLDLILTRAVAAIFNYRSGALFSADYYPNDMPEPRLTPITEPLDARELELVVAMERQLEELKLAASAIGVCDADILLLDGSVVPQYIDRFPHSKKVLELHRALIDAYLNLYEGCARSDTLLAGVVKDSRGARFIEILMQALPSVLEGQGLTRDDASTLAANRDVLANSRDTVFLDHVLETGERSSIFKYADTPSVLRDLGEWGQRVHAFYLKAVPYDCPLRIEFVNGGEDLVPTAERVASLVYALSSYHDAYGLPSVLIEADARAHLYEEDLDIVRDSIADRLGMSTSLDLRRQRRPF